MKMALSTQDRLQMTLWRLGLYAVHPGFITFHSMRGGYHVTSK